MRTSSSPSSCKRQIALAARTLLERRLQQLPVLFVVEDLHWADAASVDLLRDLADQLADRRLMMLLVAPARDASRRC